MKGNEMLLASMTEISEAEAPATVTTSYNTLPTSSQRTDRTFQYSLHVSNVVNISITTTSYEYIGGNIGNINGNNNNASAFGSNVTSIYNENTENIRINETDIARTLVEDNYWALLAIILVVVTAGGNILVCLAITWERRLQNVTNYFLMSLAITDLMVALMVMPFAILTLFK
uniref:G-protein coupled receptors family 1 profile domain-containing protein n=1 Tax=Megaselia scalaris TaxID=36166 RepID=T1GTR2_MEGSC